MIDPELVPRDALDGVNLGVSVSTSADLARVGLTSKHAEIAIGEIARALLVAGGVLTYGGRIKPSGFTQLLMSEVRRYGQNGALTVCLALPEHRRLDLNDIDEIDRSLGTVGVLVCLDDRGEQINPAHIDRGPEGEDIQDAALNARSYSGLRNYMARNTDARVILGGQLGAVKGAMPGVIEECILSLEASQPIYVAGGFGGAAAAIAKALDLDDLGWAPADFPAFDGDDGTVTSSLALLRDTATNTGWPGTGNGLTTEETRQLASSHRPGEVASLVAIGLARRFAGSIGN